MRDGRFIAAHRGGHLELSSHRLVVRWAADCAERVLPLFNQQGDDIRPVHAIEIARRWANGEVKTGDAMKASIAAHAAARLATDKSAIAAARAAGHAVASAHFADHCMAALSYALKALEAIGQPWESELVFQLAKLPDHLRLAVANGLPARLKGLGLRVHSQETPDV